MSRCVYCKQRKGKRSCPALTGLICSQCCGEHRLTRISCPPDCDYLDTGSDYQQKRLGEQFAPVRRELYRQLSVAGGEKAAALFNLIPIPPLDGFGALAPHLAHETRVRLQAIGFGGYFLLILVFWTVPAAGDFYWEQVYQVAEQLQIPWSWFYGAYQAQFVH